MIALRKIEAELIELAQREDDAFADPDELRFFLRIAARKIGAQAEIVEQGLGVAPC